MGIMVRYTPIIGERIIAPHLSLHIERNQHVKERLHWNHACPHDPLQGRSHARL